MSHPERRLRLYLPSIVAFVLVLVVAHLLVNMERARLREELMAQASREALSTVARLETELNADVYLANGLVAYLSAEKDPGDEGIQTALRALFSNGRHLRNIGLAPGNRVRYVFPLLGNESVIGLYYPDVPAQWPAVKRAMDERSTLVAGPVELLQGGQALISRTPIYLDNGRYWGMFSLVINARELFHAAGLLGGNTSLKYALRGKDGSGKEGAVFLGDEDLFQQEALLFPINIPGGQWELGVRPAAGWQVRSNFLYFLEFMGLLLGGSVASALYGFQQGRLRIEMSEMRLRAFMGTTRDGVVVIDERGMVQEFNPGAERLFGYGAEEVMGLSVNRLMPVEDAATHDQHLYRARGAPGRTMSPSREVMAQRKDGSLVPVEVSVGEALVGGQYLHVGVVRDITERKAFEQRLLELATRDSLTGALNRRAFTEAMEGQLALARRYGQPMTLLMLDADHFKQINDRHGHHVGDQVLVHLADQVRSCLRGCDSLGRWGGEEFVVLLPQTEIPQGREVAERLLAAIRQDSLTPEGMDCPLPYRISIGVAAIVGEGTEGENLIQRADEALYRAKDAGRDCWRD